MQVSIKEKVSYKQTTMHTGKEALFFILKHSFSIPDKIFSEINAI